jgi:hypothetical protein
VPGSEDPLAWDSGEAVVGHHHALTVEAKDAEAGRVWGVSEEEEVSTVGIVRRAFFKFDLEDDIFQGQVIDGGVSSAIR